MMRQAGGERRRQPEYLVAGDCALVVEYGDRIDAAINERVRRLDRRLAGASIPGVIEAVPTYRSLMIIYDPGRIGLERLIEQIRALEDSAVSEPVPARAPVLIPTVYGGAYGPDLEFVARHNGLTEAEVVRMHSSADYTVYMIGFTPGFPYLGGMPESIATPRLATPRTSVPAGSVGIAGNQTGVYPVESPGGWRLIGRTALNLFDPARENPVLLRPGDPVRFAPITGEELERAQGRS